MKNIPSFISEISDEMVNAAVSAFQNEKFILGESVFKFEEEFAKYIGTKYAIAVNSGSSAIQLSLISLGLNFASNKINSLSDQLGGVLEKLSNTCSNESFIINTIQRIDNVDTFADMTASEFYRTVNVSELDLSDRADKIEQLLTSQRSLIDNLIEAPSNVLSNNGIPNNNQGNQGDYYINTQNNQIYGPKLSDTNWGTPLN